MTDPAIPNAADAIGQGISALVALRPAAILHIDSGKYGNVFTGWRGQQALLIARIVDEVAQSRLSTAFGDGLRQLVASEFDIIIQNDGSAPAVGIFQINRTNVMTPGTIPRGSRLRRLPVPTLSPPVREASYALTEDVYLQQANYVANLPVVCTQNGTIGNTPADDGTGTTPYPSLTQQFQFVDQVFDPTIAQQILGAQMGGGADPTTDDDLRRFARAMASGRYAPTISALIAFAYQGYGVRRAAVYEDSVSAITRIQIADGSRFGSALWASQVQQSLLDTAVGFGCRVQVGVTFPSWVNVQPTITLRDSQYANYTTDISNNVRAAVNDYFTTRDDFLTFKASALRARISRADPRILTCTAVTVTSPQGLPFSDTTPYVPGNGPPTAFFTLANNGLLPTYLNPS